MFTFCIRQAIANIHRLLKPDGTSLVSFVLSCPIFDVFLALSQMSKYSNFMSDINKFIGAYHHEETPLNVIRDLLRDAGFKVLHMETKDQTYDFKTSEGFTSNSV